jgi:hypothetical protein
MLKQDIDARYAIIKDQQIFVIQRLFRQLAQNRIKAQDQVGY